MKVLNKLPPLQLLALVWTGCNNRSARLTGLTQPVYTSEYASDFDVQDADGKEDILITVTNPWQERTALPHSYSSPETANPFPKDSRDKF